MENEQIIIDKDDLDRVMREGAYSWRRMIFDLGMEDYVPPLEVKRTKWRRKNVAIIDIREWDAYEEWICGCLEDLSQARDMIKAMQSVYDEYHGEYEEKHNIKLDDLICMQITSCDADEFERVRDRFEKEYFRDEDDEEPER